MMSSGYTQILICQMNFSMFKIFRIIKKYHKKRFIIYALDKRQKFAIETIILTCGILTTQFVWPDLRFYMVFILGFIGYLLTVWSLTEDIKGIEWVFLFLLPVLFTIAMSLFYFLLPERMIIRLATTVAFAVGTYAILLIENIYNVASERSIQLLRAAQSVGLLMTLIVLFLFANIFFSLRLPYYLNFIFFTGISFLLALQSIWTVKLEPEISKEIFSYSGIVSILIGELAYALSFWPVENASYSLMIASSFYCLVGIIQHYFHGRLFANIIREHILVFVFTLLLVIISTHWSG